MNEAHQDYDLQWWLGVDNAKHDALISTVKYIRSNQEYRKQQDLLFQAMYGGQTSSGYGFGSSMRRSIVGQSRLSLNVCRNMVGAVTSKIGAKNKPKPSFLTDTGDYELRQKAENLEKFVSGVFYDEGVYKHLPACFRDACVYGTGFLKVWPENDRVCVERVMPMEMVVDDVEGRYGSPSNMYHRHYVDRLTLLDDFAPEDDTSDNAMMIRAVLMSRQSPDPDDAEYGFQTAADAVLVTEGWHLGRGRDQKGGRHVIAAQGCTLLDEEWDGPFPFAVFRWSKPLEGFYGVGLVKELLGIQREINKLLQQIQRGHHLITGHYLKEASSKFNAAMLNNDLAAIVSYSGTAPTYQVPSIIAPEVYSHLWQLYAKSFEITGISQLSAQGQKPAGLDSGVALRTYQDIQTERFLEVGQDYEEFVVETARQVVRSAKRIGGGYRVADFKKGGVEFIDWSDVDIEEDLYRIRVMPTSLLPSDYAGKMQWAQDMTKSGLMPQEDVLETLDFPDTGAFVKRTLAPRKIIERNIAHMLKTGDYVTPEPFDDHKLALRLVNQAYHEARLDGVPDDRLDKLRQYMADTNDILNPPAPPGAAMPPGAPPMAPPPPPSGPPPGAPMPGPPQGIAA